MFTRPKKAIGLDIGSHSVKAVQMSRSAGRLFVDEASIAHVDRNRLSADPTAAQAEAVIMALEPFQSSRAMLVGALAGQTVVIRYQRIARVGNQEMDDEIRRAASQIIPYDLDEVLLDWTDLGSVDEGDDAQARILLVAAKHEVITSRLQILDEVGVQCGVFSVDSLALADAAEACGMLGANETVALINIGLTSDRIHFIKDGVSNFIRDVSWGSRELVQAIAKERHCEYEKAEQLLRDLSNPPTPEEGPLSQEEAQAAEKTAEDKPDLDLSSSDPFGDPGGGSLLDPLDEEIGGAPAASRGSAVSSFGTDERDLSEVVSGPMSRMVSEIRRSFDYYEHQLYERPVERLILSGGIAHIPMVGETLIEELGVETVEVAAPMDGAVGFGEDRAVHELLEHPAQFMVAIGLAARGMSEL